MRKRIPLETAEPLVFAIQKRDILYNTRNPHYKNRNMTELAWKDVSDEVQHDVTYCKTTWATLRGTYNRILAQMRLPSGPGIIWRPPKWYLFKQMSFLRDHVVHGHIIGNVAGSDWNISHDDIGDDASDQSIAEGDDESSCQDEFEQKHTVSTELVENSRVPQIPISAESRIIAFSISPSTNETADHELSTSVSASTSTSSRVPTSRVEKRKFSECDPLQHSTIDVKEKKPNSLDRDIEDPMIMYLKSLIPFINKLTETNKHRFIAQTTNSLMEMILSQDSE